MGNSPSTEKIRDPHIGTKMGSTKVSEKPRMTQEPGTGTSHEKPEAEKGKETMLEHFHTPGSLGNVLTWGDQPIPEPVDEVVDVQAISYD
jgi:hypothetical protein